MVNMLKRVCQKLSCFDRCSALRGKREQKTVETEKSASGYEPNQSVLLGLEGSFPCVSRMSDGEGAELERQAAPEATSGHLVMAKMRKVRSSLRCFRGQDECVES